MDVRLDDSSNEDQPDLECLSEAHSKLDFPNLSENDQDDAGKDVPMEE